MIGIAILYILLILYTLATSGDWCDFFVNLTISTVLIIISVNLLKLIMK